MKHNAASPNHQSRPPIPWLQIASILLAGLVLRVWTAAEAPMHGYKWDHFDNVGMGVSAEEHGLLDIYTIESTDDLVPIPGHVWHQGQFREVQRKAIVLPNYPPLAITIFWLQAKMLPRPLHVNTFATRMIMGLVPMLAGLLAAWGAWLVARDLGGMRAAMVAGAVTWLAPPIFLNTMFWGQVDTFILAPTMFLVYFMLRGKWLLAGLMLALACLLKPQGLVLGPIVLFAAIAVPAGEGAKAGARAIILRLVKLGVVFVAGVVVISAPWLVSTGTAWVKRAYMFSFLEAFPKTTLAGYNIWYVDLLIADARSPATAIDSSVKVLGLTKDMWGRVLTFSAMFGFAALCLWRLKRTKLAVVAFSALWLWGIFMLPTRVHERFIVYCVPMLAVLAMLTPWKRFWPALAVVLIVGAAEHSWPVWMEGVPAGRYRQPPPYEQYVRQLREYNRAAAQRRVPLRPVPTEGQYRKAVDRSLQSYRRKRAEAGHREHFVTALSIAGFLWAAIALALPAGGAGPLSGEKKAGKPKRKRRK